MLHGQTVTQDVLLQVRTGSELERITEQKKMNSASISTRQCVFVFSLSAII